MKAWANKRADISRTLREVADFLTAMGAFCGLQNGDFVLKFGADTVFGPHVLLVALFIGTD